MKVFIVYSCYSESFDKPSIYFEACGTLEKAEEIFRGYKENIIKQARDRYEEMEYGDEKTFEDVYSVEDGNRIFECIEMDGDKSWESYIVEQELLV